MREFRVERIEEIATIRVEILTESDRRYIEGFTSAKRRREVASWRALLRRTLREEGYEREVVEADIRYDDVGAPYLDLDLNGDLHGDNPNTPIYISVSHSRECVAIIISDEGRCAIDIEDMSRNFERVASKYTTDEEVARFAHEIDRAYALPIIWSAKETLYKIANRREIDMIEDLRIDSVVGVERVESSEIATSIQGKLTASIKGQQHHLRYLSHEGHIIVYSVQGVLV